MLNRSQARERREYLERARSNERKEEARRRRDILLNAYERDIVLPKDLRDTSKTEDLIQECIYTGLDEREDEYSSNTPPSILITTSRDPSDALVRFAKTLKFVFPSAEKMNRGKHSVKDLVEIAKNNGCTDLLLVNENRGVPSSLIISHLPHGPTACFSLHNVNTGDFPAGDNVGVLFDNLTSKLGLRIKRILGSLFNPIRKKPKRVIGLINREDFIMFRQSIVEPSGDLTEVLPSFDMRLYEISAGTLDMDYVEKEYVFRPYLNTARKKLYLGEEVE